MMDQIIVIILAEVYFREAELLTRYSNFQMSWIMRRRGGEVLRWKRSW